MTMCMARLAAAAVGWGIGNTKGSIEECAEACRQHKPKGPSDGGCARLAAAKARCCCACGCLGGAQGAHTAVAWANPLPHKWQPLPSAPHPACCCFCALAGPFGNLPCNAFAWCAFDNCFEPDAHKHGKGDCWLKFTEGPASPEVNMRGRLSLAAQKRHPQAPKEVQWHAGVLLPHGVTLTNGSWSPRHDW